MEIVNTLPVHMIEQTELITIASACNRIITLYTYSESEVNRKCAIEKGSSGTHHQAIIYSIKKYLPRS